MKIIRRSQAWSKARPWWGTSRSWWWTRAGMGMLVLCAATALPTEAQLGGVARRAARAATGAVVQEASPVAAAAPESESRSENGRLLTSDLLDRLETGLAAELTESDEVARVLATRPSAEDRARCEQMQAMSPAAQALLADYLAAVEKAGEDEAAMLRAMQEFDAKMRAHNDRECGVVFTPDEERDLQRRPALRGAEAAGLTEIEYAIVKERVAPFCEAGGAAAPDGQVRIPVPDSREAYVYEAAEAEVLRPRCATLMPVLAEIG